MKIFLAVLMKGLFSKVEIKSENILSKQDKKKLNALVSNRLDIKQEYKLYHISSKLKIVRNSTGDSLFFEYFDKIFPTIKNFDKAMYKKVVLDSGAVDPLTRGADVMCPGVIKYKEQADRFASGDIVGVEIIDRGIFAVGLAVMSFDEMIAKKEGAVIEVLHVAGDQLDSESI